MLVSVVAYKPLRPLPHRPPTASSSLGLWRRLTVAWCSSSASQLPSSLRPPLAPSWRCCGSGFPAYMVPLPPPRRRPWRRGVGDDPSAASVAAGADAARPPKRGRGGIEEGDVFALTTSTAAAPTTSHDEGGEEVGPEEEGDKGGGGPGDSAPCKGGGGLGGNTPTPTAPAYDGTALPRQVFDDPHFYGGDADEAAYFAPRREEAFRKYTTVDEVRREYGYKPFQLANRIGADLFLVRDYFQVTPMETRLAELGILALPPSNQVEVYKSRRLGVGAGMPSAVRLCDAVVGGKFRRDREYSLCYVLGPSGSGTTFLALEHLRNFLNDKDLPSVTLFVSPKELMRRDEDFEPRYQAPLNLGNAVERAFNDALTDLFGAAPEPWSGPLPMHACVVFDDAASTPALRKLFDDPNAVKSLLGWIKQSKMAESVVVVVAGTGLAAVADAFVFRLPPWKRQDLMALLNHFIAKPHGDKDRLELKSGEASPEVLADAIFSLPLLEALATNGRTAHDMVRAVASATRKTFGFRNEQWRSHLSFLVPTLVDEVASAFVESNDRIRGLSDGARRRVAACVFGELSRVAKYSTKLPAFEGLNADEAAAALALTQINVRRWDGGVYLLQPELYAASVTPAVAIVLFHMAGVLTGVLTGWTRGEDVVAALCAAQHAIVERFHGHVRDIRELQSRYGTEVANIGVSESEGTSYDEELQALIEKFDESLNELCVYRLRRPILSNPGGSDVAIPIVPRNSILIDVEEASFPTVIAPYRFLQTKRTSTSPEQVSVNLATEVDKCCLLKSSTADLALRGLLALWGGAFGHLIATMASTKEEHEPASGQAQREFQTLQTSNAYPVNLIGTRQAVDGVEYAEILRSGRVSNSNMVLPPLPASLDVTFVFSTNAERAVLALPGDFDLPVTGASLDDELQLDVKQLNDHDRGRWLSFLESLRDGVKLQFLFSSGV